MAKNRKMTLPHDLKRVTLIFVTGSKHAQQPDLADALPLSSPARSKVKLLLKPRTVHGGERSVRKRKTIRPFEPQAAMHLVLKSNRARGAWSFLHRKNRSHVSAMIYTYAKRFKVRIYQASITKDHIHLLVRAHERKPIADFLRVFAGRTAVVISGAKKGQKRIGKFWDYLCWSRLVNWGRDFFQVRAWVKERLEQRENNLSEPKAFEFFVWNEWNLQEQQV